MIYVLNEQFERIDIISDYSYLLWRKRYSAHGEAELHVKPTEKNIRVLKRGHILLRTDDSEAMYIHARYISEGNNNDLLKVHAYSLSRWLDRRIIWGTKNLTGTPETIVRNLITSECITPTVAARKIACLELANASGFGTSISLQTSYANLLEKVEDICNTYEMGMRSVVDLRTRKMSIHFYNGTDRTVNQKVNPRCVLSKRFANVISSEFEESDNGYRNTVLVAGAGEGSARKLTSIEQGADLARCELYVDARDLQATRTVGDVEQPIPDAEYTLLMKQRGLEKLLENEQVISLDSEIDISKNNTLYGRDFFLGDIITVRDDKLDLTLNTRITEVDEVFQNSVRKVYTKIGKQTPTLVQKVRKMVK
ncbi:MAG: siphovirus ReqiPepy6 Gp37-like family protein [Bacilli bacterium]